MLALALAAALAAAQTSPAPAAPPASPAVNVPPAAGGAGAPGRGDGVQPLETAREVEALCDALAPADRAAAAGDADALARSRAEARHGAAREAALARRYRTTVPSSRLRFGAYDPDEKALALSDRAFLAGAGGALRIWAAEGGDLPVRADEAAVERILSAARKGTLALALTFALPEDDDAATCAHPAAGSSWSLGVDPVAWEYLEGDRVLARGGEGGDRPVVSAADGARPRVEVSYPVGEGGRELQDAVRARSRDLEGCYARALQANPSLDGAIVAEVELGAGGGARAVRVAADSLGDDAMSACVRDVLQRVSYPAARLARADIPIHFELDALGAASGQGAGAR